MLYKGFYLVEITDGKVTCSDGSHSRRLEVTKTLELYSRLGMKKENSSYFMVNLKKDTEIEKVHKEELTKYAGAKDIFLKLTKLIDSKVLKLEEVSSKKVKLNESALKVLVPVMKAYSNLKQG